MPPLSSTFFSGQSEKARELKLILVFRSHPVVSECQNKTLCLDTRTQIKDLSLSCSLRVDWNLCLFILCVGVTLGNRYRLRNFYLWLCCLLSHRANWLQQPLHILSVPLVAKFVLKAKLLFHMLDIKYCHKK